MFYIYQKEVGVKAIKYFNMKHWIIRCKLGKGCFLFILVVVYVSIFSSFYFFVFLIHALCESHEDKIHRELYNIKNMG